MDNLIYTDMIRDIEDTDLIMHLKNAHSVSDVIGLFETIDDIHQLIVDLGIQGADSNLFDNNIAKSAVNQYFIYPLKLKRDELERMDPILVSERFGNVEMASKKDLILCWIIDSLDIAYNETESNMSKNVLAVLENFVRYLIQIDLCDNPYVIHKMID